MTDKKTQVGRAMNFRGFMYQPINEQGVIYLFGLVAEDLNIIIESIQQGYPDCTGLRYIGNNRYERIRIEFEFKSSHFDHHGHRIDGCDIIVCWEDDFSDKRRAEIGKAGIEIIELKSVIDTPEVPNRLPKNPEDKAIAEFNLNYHFKKSNATKTIQELFGKLDSEIKKISSDIWDKYSKSFISYYSPDKLFLGVHLQKNGIRIEVFTNREKLEWVKNTLNHENWGNAKITNETDLKRILPSLYKSYEVMKKAEKEGINTGWYAFTPDKKDTICKNCMGTGEEPNTDDECRYCDGTGYDTEGRYDSEMEDIAAEKAAESLDPR